MKFVLPLLIFVFSLNAISSIYVKGDVLQPLLKVSERIDESAIDLRAGYILNDWDFSLRYIRC